MKIKRFESSFLTPTNIPAILASVPVTKRKAISCGIYQNKF